MDDALLRRGVNHLLAGQFASSLEVFGPHVSTSPQAAIHVAEVRFLRAMVTEEKRAIHEARAALKHAERLAANTCACRQHSALVSFFMRKTIARDLHRHPSEHAQEMLDHAGLDSCTVIGDALLFRALLDFRAGNYVTGGLTLRKSWKMYEAIAALPQGRRTPDSLFGIESVGFDGDREKGIQELQLCYESGNVRAPLAGLLLLWLTTFFLRDHERANVLAKDLLGDYPSGILFLYVAGYLSRFQGRLEGAVARFKAAYEAAREMRPLQLACVYELGSCYLRQRRWADAAREFQAFSEENRSSAFQAYCLYELGITNEMLSRRSEALKAFALVAPAARTHYTFDQFARRKAEQFIQQGGMRDYDRLYTRAYLELRAHEYETALETLESAEISARVDDERDDDVGPVEFLRGRCLRGLLRLDEARAAFLRAVSLPHMRKETYIYPHAYVQLAELALREGNRARAKEALKTTRQWSNYDFDKPLGRKIAAAKDTLKRLKKEARERQGSGAAENG